MSMSLFLVYQLKGQYIPSIFRSWPDVTSADIMHVDFRDINSKVHLRHIALGHFYVLVW